MSVKDSGQAQEKNVYAEILFVFNLKLNDMKILYIYLLISLNDWIFRFISRS